MILELREDFPFQELSKLLGGVLGVPAHDAAAGLRRGWGLLYKTGEPGRAEDVRRKLADGGFESFVRAASELRPLPPFKTVKKASVSDRGLVITETGQNSVKSENEFPWSSLNSALVCAGGFLEEEISTDRAGVESGPKLSSVITSAAIMIATGMPSLGKLKPGKKEVAAGKTRQRLNSYLDIISPVGPAFRVCGEAFDYSYLGNRKDYSSLVNFRKLAQDVLAFLPKAVKNKGVKALAGGAGTGFRYANKDEYEAERYWLLQLI